MINFENVMADFNGPESERTKPMWIRELGWTKKQASDDRRNMIAFEDQE